jgi:predicted nucleic acid-binding protein
MEITKKHACDAGVQILYSEDMGGIASINGMEIKNPFTFQE